jgi:hypothetical protein
VRKDLDIPRAAEWTARMLMTFHTTPSLTVNFEDEDDVRCFVRDHMVRGFRK